MMEEPSKLFMAAKSGRSTLECKDPISPRISGTAAQSAHFSSACIFTSISFGRNNEDIHPIKWLADARNPEVHHDR
jgi:hypothetical protein